CRRGPGARRRRGVVLRGDGGGLALLGALADVGEEQGLVDPALEDRDAHLNALCDDFLALEACLARELGGRQVIGHWAGVLPRTIATSCTYSATFGRRQPFWPLRAGFRRAAYAPGMGS